MARAQRRSTRNGAVNAVSPEQSAHSERSESPSEDASVTNGAEQSRSAEERCPACSKNTDNMQLSADKESWIRCDACKTWYHWRCAGNGSDVDTIDKWFCTKCLAADPTRVITEKAPARKSSRKRTQRDYANLNSGLGSDPSRWMRMLDGKDFEPDKFKRMAGRDVTIEWLYEDETAMKEPVLIESPEGLGMKMPPSDFTVEDVVDLIGEDTPVEVIDVASQSAAHGWTLGKWADYYDLEASAREKVLNVISLEVSGTKLSDMIMPPRLVREMDWVENFWPGTRKGKGHTYPKVQLYCLMGVTNAWTDWHVDFAGSSVYYHILHGSKIFYFIRPTPANLAAYERWSGTEIQNHSWLGDMVDEVVKVVLTEGNTMLIPSGWIHAVYTPVDTLVFGGNFLHSFDVPMQLKVRQIEIATHVPKKFRFPLFTKLCWYVAEKYLRDLKAKDEFTPRVLESLSALADFLVSESKTLDRGTEQAKREAKEQIPSDRVKDPSAMARELRWRVRQAAGYDSDDGGTHRLTNGNAHKRRRLASEEFIVDPAASIFRNFKPKTWDRVIEKSEGDQRKAEQLETWEAADGDSVQWADFGPEAGREADVQRQRHVIVKVRKTAKGMERQRIERVVEQWHWDRHSVPE